LESDFGASGLEGSSALGISPPVSGASTKESGSISCGALCDGRSQKTTKHKERFKLSLPVGSTHSEPAPGGFQRSWSRRWVGSQIIDLDS
jgi:hypothetical protein